MPPSKYTTKGKIKPRDETPTSLWDGEPSLPSLKEAGWVWLRDKAHVRPSIVGLRGAQIGF